MFTKCWLVIKDEAKRTYEVVGQASNDNAFSNKAYAMQKDGMKVSAVILPVTNHYASKESIKFVGYQREAGLHERLLSEHRAITLRNAEQW